MAPGNSIGTLSINGNYVQAAGSIYEVEINPAGESDLIDITGTATIENQTTVNVVRAPGTYAPGTQYTILTADGGVTGTYSNLTQSISPFLDLALLYDANNVFLQVALSDTPLTLLAVTPNQTAVANSVTTLGVGNPVFNAVVNLPDSVSFQQALDLLSGEVHASALGVFMEESRYLRNATLNRLHHALSTPDSVLNQFGKTQQVVTTDAGTALWVDGFGAWGELNGNRNAAEVDRSTKGLFLGADTTIDDNVRLGVLTGFTHSNMDVDARRSNAASDNYHLGIYGGTRINHWGLRAGAAYTWHDINTQRSVVFPGFNNWLTADYHGDSAQAFAEIGYETHLRRMGLEPFANLAYVKVDSGRFFEKGGPAALRGDGQEEMFYSTLGLREAASIYKANGTILSESLLLGWRHAYNDINPQAKFLFTGSSLPFAITGAPVARNSLLIDAGLNVEFPAKNASFRLAYIGQWANKVHDNGVSGTLTWKMA